MEDPGVEWEIQDYSCNYLEDEEETEKQSSSSSKLGWILKTGLSIGKKFVITGVVISSAPIILPPLIAVSALGFACSVPFGFIFASYACTQKLMSKLLMPSPPQYPMIDYYVTEEEAKEEEMRDEIENVSLMENIEKEDLSKRDQIRDANVENEYEESTVVGESLLGKDEEDGLNKKEELETFKEEKQSFNVVGKEIGVGGDVMAKDDSVEVAREEDDRIKSKEIVDEKKETEPLLVAQTIDLNKGKSVVNSNNENVEIQKIVPPEKKGKEKEKKRQNNSKGKSITSMGTDKKGNNKTSTIQKSSGNRKRQEGDKKHEKETKTSVESKSKTSHVKKAKLEGGEDRVPEANATTDVISKSSTEKPQSGPRDRVLIGSDDNANSGKSSKLEQIVLPSGKKDVGGDLDTSFDEIEKNVGSKGQSVEDDFVVSDVYYEKKDENNKSVDVLAIETTKEYHGEGTIIEDKTKYSLEVTDTRDVPELKHHGDVKDLPELKRNEEIPDLKVDVKNVRPDEVLISDEKIWKQIDAIRVIIGFNAPRSTSYFEELKALYLFTGIEPPLSLLMGSSDLAEFYNKLRFLMSVIGVK